jgi:multicomponent Na+:H+ antiporter subunit D
MTASPALTIAVPLLGAAAIAAFRQWLPRVIIDLLAVLAALLNLVLCLLLLRLSCAHSIVYWYGNWFPRGRMVVGIGFLVQPAGASLAGLAAFLTLLALVYSWNRMESGQNHYQPLMLIFLAAMTGFCLTADLFNLFVFFELMSTAAFALCGLKVDEPAPLQGSFNFAVTNTVGAFFTLTGIALIYGATGALNMAQIGWLIGSRHDTLVVISCLFLITGFLIKAAIVPFHFWLPDAHAVAPTPVCVLFSGVMVELGLFAILRISTVVFGSTFAGAHNPLRLCLLALGGLTAVWGGVMCFAEHHLKRILAFSTISHSGVMLLAVGIGSPIAISGWLTYLFAHAMIKSGLFFTAGIVLHRLRTMSEPALFQRGRELKVTAGLWLLGGLGLAGLPPFATAFAGDLVSQASSGHLLSFAVPALLLISGALTGAAVYRVFLRVFVGWGDAGPVDRASQIDERPETGPENRTTPVAMFVPAFVCTILGIAFWPLLRLLSQTAVLRLGSQRAYIAAIYGASSSTPLTMNLPSVKPESMILHGLLACACGGFLALAAVFHLKLPRPWRAASHLEGKMSFARQIQSGQPADYVVWAMLGVGVLGIAFLSIH